MTIASAARRRAGPLRCAESTQDLRRFMVGLWHEVRVHVERRRRVSVSQATCHGPYVDAGAQQTGGDVVPEVVQAHPRQSGVVARLPEPTRGRVRVPRRRTGDVACEHERIVGERSAALLGSLAFGDENDTPIVPRDTVVLTSIRLDWTPPPGTNPDEYVAPVAEVVPLDAELVAQVTRVVPDAQISPRRVVVPDWPADQRQSTPPSLPPTVLVADDTIRELLGLSERDTEAADRAGVLDTSVWDSGPDTGPAPQDYTVTVPTASGDRTVEVVFPKDRPGSRGGEWGGVITEDLAAELGLDIVDAGLVLRAPAELTRDQRDALGDIQDDLWQTENTDAFVEPGDDPPTAREDNFVGLEQRVTYEWVPIMFPRALLDATALAAALLLTLMVVAIGLSLAATESRDERDVLLAVGAPPRTMRSVAATKATVLTAGAALLAIPTGYLPVAAVITAAPDDNHVTFPWLTALGLLIVIPVMPEWQRLRPPYSRNDSDPSTCPPSPKTEPGGDAAGPDLRRGT